jgi:hypothetical protein
MINRVSEFNFIRYEISTISAAFCTVQQAAQQGNSFKQKSQCIIKCYSWYYDLFVTATKFDQLIGHKNEQEVKNEREVSHPNF